MAFPDDVALPQGSLVLVTGVTGFIASVVADELLKKGYRVRGTARSVKSDKASWMPAHFDKAYGKGQFELVEVPDVGVPNSLHEAVKGCDAVAHLASNLSFKPDPNIVVKDAVNFARNALEAAMTESRVKRFVFCSSTAAIDQHRFDEEYDLTPEMWNTVDPPVAWAPPPYTPERMVAVYSTSKVEAEQLFWKFMEERKPHFVGNSVLPDFVLGIPVNVAKQGLGPSGTVLKGIWDGDEMYKLLGPQFVVDVKDVALLHIAALVKPDMAGERVYGMAWRRKWSDVFPMLKRMYPDHDFPAAPENESAMLANVTARPRADQALKWLGQDGWTPVEESYKESFDVIRDDAGFVSHVLGG